ncbi:UNVERIFIED_CONTAM: hypothetical protein Slati_3460600 [Sesamum latifolium]|uniref:Reverse transcriptase domain-containing protein n=1 Tax=Sesamum latifolium TaxID=2727402 RepID=A0AAW2UI00_9LAMI
MINQANPFHYRLRKFCRHTLRRCLRSNAVGRYPLEEVNTSLYGFAGEVVHPSGRNLYVSYEDQIPYSGRSWRGTGRPLQSRRCYVEVVRKGQKRSSNEALKEAPFSKKGRECDPEEDLKIDGGTPPNVQPTEELLNIELIPGDPEKVTQIGSQMDEAIRKKVIQCLRRNVDVFAWTPQDLEGINPKVITHHLNIDPRVKPVKQKKRHFGPEKDKIIQAEINKLMAVEHVEEIQFPRMVI